MYDAHSEGANEMPKSMQGSRDEQQACYREVKRCSQRMVESTAEYIEEERHNDRMVESAAA